jgi:NADH-quinone oxidoreductase subunit L
MIHLLWLIPTLPFLGALILVLTSSSLSRRAAAIIGCSTIGLAALITVLIGYEFLATHTEAYRHVAWNWFAVSGLSVGFSFHLDALSLVFLFVITFVGFFIHLYSVAFMHDDAGFTRFFAYLNLFVCAMLILVLADNLVLLYLGWEGVGLCSYLLIGFWYDEEKNGYAARKAFIMTRVGDTALAIGLFMLFGVFHTLDIQEILTQAPKLWSPGTQTATIIAFLLLGGAVGKSAQLPLQTWLPDAMAGPSPVSALIHAATMVTAGVYLIARMHGIYELAPLAQLWVGIIGAVTLLIAGCSALTQNDLKRVLAYSTISQIGYMFLALGIGAWSAAVFHFMIHAFFKALLFLGAGTVIWALHHEHDMFKMGGLRKRMPVVYWTFLIGAGSLAAIPLVTAGFYSKDQILWLAWASAKGSPLFFIAALTGAFITSVYTFRMVFVTFFGAEKTHTAHLPGKLMHVALIVLAVLSLVGGFIELPHTFGHVTLLSDLLHPILPATVLRAGAESSEVLIQLIAATVALSGVLLAYIFYIVKPSLADEIESSCFEVHQLWYAGWRFDALYNLLIVRPFVWVSTINKRDIIDQFYTGLVSATEYFGQTFSRTQTGVLRWYIMGITAGAVIIFTLSLFINR